MKVDKLVVSIASIIFFFVIVAHAVSVGIGSVASAQTHEVVGSPEIFVGVFMIAAGVTGIVKRKKIYSSFIACGLYIAGGILGLLYVGTYSSLLLWIIVCFIFAAVYIIDGVTAIKEKLELQEKTTKPTKKIDINGKTGAILLMKESLKGDNDDKTVRAESSDNQDEAIENQQPSKDENAEMTPEENQVSDTEENNE